MFSLERGHDFSGSGSPSWTKKANEDQAKKASNKGTHLSIDFSRFWWISGHFSGSKIGPKSIKKGIEEMMTKKMVFGRHLGPRIINRFQPEKANFRKSCSRSSGGTIFQDLGQLMGR